MNARWLVYAAVLVAGGLIVCIHALVGWARSRTDARIDEHAETAMAIVQPLPPCDCAVCADLTDSVVNFAFDEAVEDGLSPAEYRRMNRLGVLFPPASKGRDR